MLACRDWVGPHWIQGDSGACERAGNICQVAVRLYPYSPLIAAQLDSARCRFESGVHRVQRVPTTETKGRVHTSTASVVIMPEPTEVSNYIDPKDLRIGAAVHARSMQCTRCARQDLCADVDCVASDVYRASGAGGQHVNTTESAVRITHVPTGIQAAIQDERSQHQNRAKALVLVAARVYEQRRAEEDQVRRRHLIDGS